MRCIVCKRPLSGLKKKFCSLTCAQYLKQKKAQQEKFANKAATRPCVECGEFFQPVSRKHMTCSRHCLYERNLKQKKESRRQLICNSVITNVSHTKPIFNKNCSHNKSAIEEFLKRGGRITTLPNAPAGKSPEVNLRFGWIPEELFGNALLYEMDLENE